MILCGKNVGRGGESAVSVYGSELAAARRDWWSAIVTPGPADRETAEAAVSSLYAAARPGRPQAAVVWCDSPLALVRAAAEAGGGKDIAADVLYRPYRRELAALAGRTTKRYRLRSHLLAELQDARARRIIDAFWDSAFDTVKVAERHAWEATQGSVWDYFLYGGDIDVRETVQPEFVGSLALTQFQRDALGFVARSSAPCDLVRSCGGFILRERLALRAGRLRRLRMARSARPTRGDHEHRLRSRGDRQRTEHRGAPGDDRADRL